MKSLINVLIASFVAFNMIAQNPVRTCPSDEKNNQLLQTDPVFHRSFQNMERILRQRESAPYLNDRIDGVLTIPVVVHVIHLGESVGTGSNISEAQVQSAIAALNEDFRRLQGTNGFGNGVDVELEFCLASRNPQNQSTNGIVRVNGSSVPNYSTQGITANGTVGASESAVKALSTWPRDSYMNIWVVSEIENNNGGAGIQGYAYFPLNSPLDGVVVQYRAFGTTGTLNSFTDANRTLTHEVGHYLNLFHTFENTQSCNPSGACETQGDRVCDTPPTVQNSSCSSPSCSGAQVANYMDYTPETCQNMFTAGQKLRMRTALETQRGSLLNSLGCVPVNALDIGVSAILDPVDTVCEGSLTPVAVIYNYGSQTITSLNLNYSLNGGAANTVAWTGTINSGASVNVSLPSINLSTGSQSITIFSSSPNGGIDENATNNSSSSNFFVAQGASAIVSVILDNWGSETTWNVSGSQGIVASGGPYQNQAQGVTVSERFCLATNCAVACPSSGGTGCNYSFNVFDAFGDGQGYQTGSISLTTASGVTTFSNNWGATQSVSFCVGTSAGTGGSSIPDANFNIQDNTVCPGTQVDFTNTSTNSPTSYSWTFEGGTPATSSASNPQNIVWDTPGTYDVTLTVTNSAGSDTYVCSNCMTVYAPPVVSLTGTNPACNGQSSGSINSTVSGTGPFTYLWSNGATTANVANIAAGSYSVTVTSSTGCNATGSATLANPATLVVTASAVNPTCSNTSNGSVSTTVTGGTGNKTYLWTPSNATTSSISNLLAGTYSVTVTDSRGCTATASSTLTAPIAITLNYSVTNVSCPGGSSGSITGSASGGSGSYNYLWTPGNAITQSISGLAGGTYSLTVTDGSGCSKTQSYTVTNPAPIVITGTVTNPNCPNGIGSISVSAAGGTGNKSFSWNTGTTGSTISVGAGSYFVTASDANGCTSTQAFTITAPTALAIVGNLVQPTCNGLSNGSISLSLPGSVGAVTYNWGGGITGASRTGLPAGTYNVTATYGIGCATSGSFTLDQPAILVMNVVSSTNPTCFDGSDGAIAVAASGGVAPYNYSWLGGTGPLLDGLEAGNYSINVNDANGCAASLSQTLVEPLAIQLEGVVSDAQCGESNGAIEVNVLNAVGIVTYNWANIVAQGSSPANLSPGSYTLNVTDENGCSGSETFLVQTPGNLALSEIIVDASCANINNGSIELLISGGLPPYSIQWSTGSNSSTISGLGAGNYSVSVTDSVNCGISEVYTVSNQYGVSISLTSTNPLCNSSNDGFAQATLIGAVEPVNYQWSNGGLGTSIAGLSGGIQYSVTGTDVNGCSASGSFSLTAPAAIVINASSTPPSCGGADNGMVFFTVTGGINGYSYLWFNGDTVISLDGIDNAPPTSVTDLAPGFYSLIITDANGCEAVRDFTLIAPSLITITDSITGVSCFGGSDASIELIASGGNGDLNIVWSNGQLGAMIDSLSAGSYTATITDANNCGVVRSYTIEDPEVLDVILLGSDPLCNGGEDGFVVSAVAGGTGGYSYLWSNLSTESSLSGLAAGFYSLIVSDENGCTDDAFVELSEPESIVIDIAITNAQCDGSILGSAIAAYSGGTPPLNYTWSDNASAGLNRSNLQAGTYTLEVSDANNCMASQSVVVYALSGATVELIDYSSPRCYNGFDGYIEVSINGGDGSEGITWLLNNTPMEGRDSTSYSDLVAGSYRIIATDTLGCSAYTEVTLENPAAITGVISVLEEISCFGESNGILGALFNGGTGALSYSWNGEGEAQIIDSLSAGFYALTITDSVGCFNQLDFELTQPDVLDFALFITNPSCFGFQDGAAEIFMVGGTSPYTYDWGGVGNGPALSDLSAGAYGFNVMDARGCEITSEIVLTEPTAMEVFIDAYDVSCNGAENGYLVANVIGGNAPYNYQWSGINDISNINSDALTDIPAGNYDLVVTDVNGCFAFSNSTVNQPEALIIEVMINDASCTSPFGDGSVTAQGGSAPYNYQWISAAGEIISVDSNVENLTPGNYSLLLSDMNACERVVDFTISEVLQLNLSLVSNNLSCFGNIDGSVTATVLNGLPPYQFIWSNGDSTQNIFGLAAGDYSLEVMDDNGCVGNATASVIMPEPMVVIIDSIANVSCNGGSDGLIAISTLGGTAPYQYIWNDEAYGSLRNDLSADTFNISVIDDMGCLVVVNQVVSEPAPITVSVVYEDQSCVVNNGSIALDVVGGVSPFNVVWSNGESGFEILELSAGDYSAVLTDINGCSASIEQSIGTYCYSSQLASSYCSTPPTVISLVDDIQCDFVEGASGYTWSFYDNGVALGTITTNSILLAVSNIPGVYPGALLGVQISVEVDGLLYPGTVDCFIQISQLPTTQLVDEDCNATITDSLFILNCEVMQDAVQYSWLIQGVSMVDTILTPDASLSISEIFNLEANQSYSVSIAYSTLDGFESSYGSPCNITMLFNTDTTTTDTTTLVSGIYSLGDFMIFPNPGNGIKVWVKNAPCSELRITDAMGRFICSIPTPTNSLGSEKLYTLPAALPSGVYYLGFDGKRMKPWIVN